MTVPLQLYLFGGYLYLLHRLSLHFHLKRRANKDEVITILIKFKYVQRDTAAA